MNEKQISKCRCLEKRGENAISETQKNNVHAVVEDSCTLTFT